MRKLIIMLGIIISSALIPMSTAELSIEDDFNDYFISCVDNMSNDMIDEYVETGISPIITMSSFMDDHAGMTETMKRKIKSHFIRRGIILSDDIFTVKEERWITKQFSGPSNGDWDNYFESIFNAPIFDVNRNQILKAIENGHYHKIVYIIHNIYNGWSRAQVFKAMNFLIRKYENNIEDYYLHKTKDRYMTLPQTRELDTANKLYLSAKRDVDQGVLAICMKRYFANKEWRKGIKLLMQWNPKVFDSSNAISFIRKYYYKT